MRAVAFLGSLSLVACQDLFLAAPGTPQKYADSWMAFKEEYGRSYAPEDEPARFTTFVSNMQRAEKLQRSNPLALFGVNGFADMSVDEFKVRHSLDSHFRSARPLPEPASLFLEQEVRATLAAVDTIDWRTKGAVTPVKDQGSCGSCWAFSTVANIEGAWVVQGGGPLTSLSEQELVSFVHGVDGCCDGCNGGLMDPAFKWLLKYRNGSIASEQDCPYVGGGLSACGICKAKTPAVTAAWCTANCYAAGPKNCPPALCDCTADLSAPHITGYKDLPHNEDQMATWLVKNGPIAIGVDAGEFQTYKGGILTTCNTQMLDHGVALVGFGEEQGQKYWIIKNSWGEKWGEAGYIRVAYGSNQCGLKNQPSTATL